MAFSSSLSRERASLTKQARIYSDQHNDQTSRFYEDAKRDGIYSDQHNDQTSRFYEDAKRDGIYSDPHNDQTSRFYEDAKRDGIYAEVEVEEAREGDRRRMNVVEKPQLLNVSIISFLSCMRKILLPHS